MIIDSSKIDPNDIDFIEIIRNVMSLKEESLDNIDTLNKLISIDTNNFCKKYIKNYGVLSFFMSLKEMYTKYSSIIKFETNDNRNILHYLNPNMAANIKNRQLPGKGTKGRLDDSPIRKKKLALPSDWIYGDTFEPRF